MPFNVQSNVRDAAATTVLKSDCCSSKRDKQQRMLFQLRLVKVLRALNVAPALQAIDAKGIVSSHALQWCAKNSVAGCELGAGLFEIGGEVRL